MHHPPCAVSFFFFFSNPSPPLVAFTLWKFLCKSFIKTMGVVGVVGTRGKGGGVGCHGFLTIATDKPLQSIKEFPHISWIIWSLRKEKKKVANAGYHREPGRVPPSSSAPPPSFSQGKLCFISSFTRPHRSILLLSLPYSRSLLSLFFCKASLCVTPVSVPICYAVHIVNREVQPEWWLLSLALRKGFCPAANLCSSTLLFHLGPVHQQGHQCLCTTAGLPVFLLIKRQRGQALRRWKLWWLSLSRKSQIPPPPRC